jgi:hypothetical protein
MRYYLSFLILWIATDLVSQEIICDTITDFANPLCNKAVFKSATGATYEVEFVEEENRERGLESVNCLDSIFAGKARSKSKLTIVAASFEDFETVSALIKNLGKESIIRTKVAGHNNRISLEKRNVRLLKDTYLFAFKKESDNDYHVIIGDHKDPNKATFFNCEISGLANATDKRLGLVRQAFEKQFVQVCNSAYAVFAKNPIKIQIEGSLFYDVDHKAGQIGPKGFRPTTVWEIHPISKITFLK